MGKLCPYCKKEHSEDDLCINLKEELRNNPGLLSQAAEFTSVAGQYHLETSQTLAHIFPGFEGSHQVTRDVQVFKRFNEDTYSRSRVFKTPETAKQYLEKATPKQQVNFSAKASGTGQEIDFLREKQGEIPSLWKKSRLYNGNAPGVDGETVNRLTGKISKTSVKAAQSSGGLHTNVKGIFMGVERDGIRTKEKRLDWIDILKEASRCVYEKKVDKEEFAKMLNAIYNLPRNELPNQQADEIYYEIKN